MDAFTLTVDTREAAVIKALGDTPHIVKQLDIGDFMITRGDVPVVLIERKTAADLLSSVTSGRHKQQRQRLSEFLSDHPDCTGVYILEGRVGVSPQVRGAIENLTFQHGFRVVPTDSASGTASALKSILRKYSDGTYFVGDEGSRLKGGSVNCGTYSRKCKISSDVFFHMLCVIPHVGEKMARVVADTWPSPYALFCAFEGHEREDIVRDLAALRVGNRKLGERGADRIVVALFGDATCV